MSNKEPTGRITIIRREKPVEGFKYRVDIAFAGKPDYSEVVQSIKKRWGEKTEPDQSMIWEHILLAAREPELADLWKVIEPVTDKITDLLLIASSQLYGYEWYRVRLFVLSDEELDADELKHEFDDAMEQYFGDGTSKGHLRFLEVTKIPKFPREGRLISKTDIPLTMKMIIDAGDRLEKKKKQ